MPVPQHLFDLGGVDAVVMMRNTVQASREGKMPLPSVRYAGCQPPSANSSSTGESMVLESSRSQSTNLVPRRQPWS
jgi:hypothetical protein